MSTPSPTPPVANPSAAQEPPPVADFHPAAAIAAAVFPGAGHYVLGERRRAAAIASGVLGLFFGGLLIGGIDTVDRQEDGWWFLPQALVGPLAFGVDSLHQNLKVHDGMGPPRSPRPDENGWYSKSTGKSNELGTLFSALAGMLNLIVVIDAAFPVRRRNA